MIVHIKTVGRRIGVLFLACLTSCFAAIAQNNIAQQQEPGRKNSVAQQEKPYVILISADGFRSDLAEKYQASQLLALREKGMSADFMLPSFPSYTFPNHYSMATGLFPLHHGIVNNNFYDEDRKEMYQMHNRNKVQDSSWYGGTPLWVLAEKQQMLSASFFWVGSEAAVQGIRPTYWYYYNTHYTMEERVQVLVDWLSLPPESRPHLILFYMPEPDHALHDNGLDSPETKKAVLMVDSAIELMRRRVDSLGLPVNYIFVSDHGMVNTQRDKAIHLPSLIDTSKFVIPSGSAVLQLYAKKKKYIRPAYKKLKSLEKDYTVYRPIDIPAQWHYGLENDRYNRLGDLLLVANPPAFFYTGQSPSKKIGYHGFDNMLTEMRASFIAWGPQLPEGKKLSYLRNVDVYPLVAQILQLKIEEDIDGVSPLEYERGR
jgi:predicted AlkP superfamily pyrophosphatase or phosphodiesterase